MRARLTAALMSVCLAVMVGCDGGGGGSSSSSSGGTTPDASDGGGSSTLASGSTTISGGDHHLSTVTAPSSGLLRWSVTRTGGGEGTIGLSVDILQGGTTLAHEATQGTSVSASTAVTAGQSYDLVASTSDTGVSITYTATME